MTEPAVLIEAASAGVAGDKYLGALIDLGGTVSRLKEVGKTVRELLPGTREVDVRVQDVERGEIAAKLVTITAKEDVDRRKGEVMRRALLECAKKLRTSDWGNKLALGTIDTLLQAESRVHRQSTESVELHELGSADTLVDILGTVSLIEELKLTKATWWSTPVAVGTGVSHFHGRNYPNPPPAVAEILRSRRFAMHSDAVNQELSTPTGVALTINLAGKASELFPSFRPHKVGYGAGSREVKETANVLRLLVGETLEQVHSHDHVVVLETNVDDVTGEVLGFAVERMLEEGARDVSITPILMKKGRPGHMITVIVDEAESEKLAKILMEETGTLGVREIPVRRHILHRTVKRVGLKIHGKEYPLTVKSSVGDSGAVVGEKGEYEDRRVAARKAGVSLREVDELIRQRGSKHN